MKKNYFTFLALLWACTALCATIYVKPNGTGNGTSWAQAYGSLTTALQNAQSGDEIWVAQGTYTPHASDITVSFVFKNGVKLYGGFAGTEALLTERADATGATTILSGQLSETLHSKLILKAENASSTLNLIDGFTIQGAHNTLVNPYNGGAGVQLLSSVIELRNLVVKDNTIEVTINNLTTDGFGGGAGIFSRQSNVTLNNVAVTGNSVTVEVTGFPQIGVSGAGIFAYVGSFTFNRGIVASNQLSGNSQNIAGAGVHLFSVGTPQLMGVKFIENYLENSATGYVHGGGLNISGSLNATVTQCLFHNNECNMGSSRNLYISGASGTVATVTNCTVGPKYQAEGVRFEGTDVTLQNTAILQVIASSGSDMNFYNCLSSYGFPLGSAVIENSENATMEFINPIAGNYTPQPCGAYIDFGNSNYITEATDLNGNPRIAGSAVDVGAIESQGAWGDIIYVDANSANTVQDGSSWDSAFTSLEDAMACGCTVDGAVVRPAEIWVAKGEYHVSSAMGWLEQQAFYLNNNQKVYGGFTAGAASLDERDINFDTNQTILSAIMENGEHAKHVVVSQDNDITAELNGFILQDALSVEAAPVTESGGGGMLLQDSHPVLKNLWIRDNVVQQYGGGMLFYYSNAEMENIRLSNNQAIQGGAMDFHNWGTEQFEVNISNLEIYDNTATSYGGAVSSEENYTVNIDGFDIHDNTSLNVGGAFFITDAVFNISRGKIDSNSAVGVGAIALFGGSSAANLTAESVVISNNTASYNNGAIFGYIGILDFTNCTFVNNTAVNTGNVIGSQGAIISIKNSIIDNPDNGIPPVAVFPSSSITNPNLAIQNSMVTDDFSTIFTQLSGVVLNIDPEFVDAANGDYRLTACSPAVNVGVNSYLSLSPLLDAEGNNRISSFAVDLGALEYQHVLIAITGQPEDIATTAGTPVQFEVVAETVENIAYQWQVSTDDGVTWVNIANANTATLAITATTAMDDNLYRCIVTADCTDAAVSAAALLEVSGTAGIDNNNFAKVMVYPNPSASVFTVQLKDATTGGNITVTDALGRVVHKEDATPAEVATGKVIKCSSWEAGTYWLKYEGNGVQQVMALIKQ